MKPLANPAAFSLALVFSGVLASAPPGALAGEGPDPHAHHHQLLHAMKRATLSTADYTLPRVSLVREDGKTVSLAEELDDGRPVALQFIFTTCATICPVMSQTFAQLQRKLGQARAKVHMVSISIDPEQDTPARLAAYARRFKAGPQWRFYTGTTQASIATQSAFEAYRGDKMDHTPVTLLRAAPGRRWVRIEGFPSSDELAQEFRALVAAN